jgi:hypothetical protein
MLSSKTLLHSDAASLRRCFTQTLLHSTNVASFKPSLNMATTISCAIDGANATGMQVTLRCIGYSPATFKGYGYVDNAGQIAHDSWQFRGSKSLVTTKFLEEDEGRIWKMAFDTGSCYSVTNTYCWPAVEINFTFRKGDQVLISLQLGQQSYTCSRTLKTASTVCLPAPIVQFRNRAIPYPSYLSSREPTTRGQNSYRASIEKYHTVSPSSLRSIFPMAAAHLQDEPPRLCRTESMPSCSKSTAERSDRLGRHQDKLKVLLLKQTNKQL